MREIKFRGKRLDGRWEYGFLMNNCYDGKVYIAYFIHKERQVDPNTVGQFTGLKDKNGKDIFEGDVILYVTPNEKKHEYQYVVKYGNILTEESWDSSHLMSVVGFYTEMINENKITNIDLCYIEETEVIGNIHDNPELLKGESK